MPQKDALKKVELIVLTALFLGLGLVMNICSASYATESRARQIEKQRNNENMLMSQRTRPRMLTEHKLAMQEYEYREREDQQNEKKVMKNGDDDYIFDERKWAEEQKTENGDLDDMCTKAAWEDEK